MTTVKAILSNLHTCLICQKSYRYKSQLLQHTKTHAKYKEILKCRVCNKVFKRPGVYNLHILTECGIKKPLYKCEICEKIFEHKYTLKSHIEFKHLKQDNVHKCYLCYRKFIYRSSYDKHFIKFHTQGLTTIVADNYVPKRNHIDRIIDEDEITYKCYSKQCEIEGIEFKNKFDYYEHNKQFHINVKC